MIQTVIQVPLPADEVIKIQKNRIAPECHLELVSGFTKKNQVRNNANGKSDNGTKLPRICVVTGIHGDELEGQYVCYELAHRIQEQKQNLLGIVDIYPAMNPLGIDTIMRGLPDFDLDMNRTFPGDKNGEMYEYIASSIIDELKGADLVIDIHASNIYLTEVPQIRINEITEKTLLPFASHMNVDFIWIHSNATVLESTLAYTMNSQNVPTLVVEMGVGMRITKEFGNQLVDGILETMRLLGAWKGEKTSVRRPIISNNQNDVCFLNAPTGGVFIKNLNAGTFVKKGDLIGTLVDPLQGKVKSEIKAEENGWLFTVREYPMVQEGSLLGRILKNVQAKSQRQEMSEEE